MRRDILIVLCGFLPGASLAGQENPFAFTGGPIKSAYIVYDLTSKQQQAPGATYELGVTPDRWIVRMITPFEMGGKKDTARTVAITTRDSQYTYIQMGSQGTQGEVSPTLRPHLAREYAALNAAGKARFKENVKLATRTEEFGSGAEVGSLITLMGEKTGSETIGGHKCDVYKQGEVSACVVPQAPQVLLRWTDDNGMSVVAKKITLNGPVPTAGSVLPKGVKWQKKPYNDADFVLEIWAFKKQSDPEAVPAEQLSKFAVGYLASPAATAELREMSGDMGDGDS